MLRAGKGLREQGWKQCKWYGRTEHGVQEDGHIPGHIRVPGTAAKRGFLALRRKEFKSEPW